MLTTRILLVSRCEQSLHPALSFPAATHQVGFGRPDPDLPFQPLQLRSGDACLPRSALRLLARSRAPSEIECVRLASTVVSQVEGVERRPPEALDATTSA